MNVSQLLDAALSGAGVEPRLTRSDVEGYSLARVLRGEAQDSFEGQLSRALSHSFPGTSGAAGVRVPWAALLTRDMMATSFQAGGAFVQTDMSPNVVSLLYNRTSCVRLGATVLEGLRGNLVLPRGDSGLTTSVESEIGATPASNPAFSQISLTPHRLSIGITVSKQLLNQSGPAAELYIRKRFSDEISIVLDRLCLNGAGSQDEPLGILNTPGIGSVVFGGAASYSAIVGMQTLLGQLNANKGRLGWQTTATGRGNLTLKAAALTGATVTCTPVWQARDWQDGSTDGMIAGSRAADSNNVPGDRLILGNWEELVIGLWGPGVDVISDIYSGAAESEVRFFCHLWADTALLHAASFVTSSDSVAQ